MAAWFGPEGIQTRVLKLDLRPGGSYRFDMTSSDGTVYKLTGAYVEISRPRRLVFTWGWLDEEHETPETLVTVELSAQGRGTALRLTHSRFTSIEGRAMHERGWTSTFESLAHYVG